MESPITVDTGLRASAVGVAINTMLAIGKVAAGIVGNSYALVADGIESTADVLGSLIVWGGLRIAVQPADQTHPFGHGKAEALAAFIVALTLLGSAAGIAIQSSRQLWAPEPVAPSPFTLVVLLGVIVIKELLFRYVLTTGESIHSEALQGDAWHHRSDAITSAAAFIGICIALIGGPGYEVADAWAALVACSVIAFNGIRFLRVAINDLMDAAPQNLVGEVNTIALQVEDVREVEKCRIRKSGLGYLVDIHVVVDGEISVRRGHEIAHAVQDRITGSPLRVREVLVHIEPH